MANLKRRAIIANSFLHLLAEDEGFIPFNLGNSPFLGKRVITMKILELWPNDNQF